MKLFRNRVFLGILCIAAGLLAGFVILPSLTNNAEVTSGTPGEPGTAADLVPVGYRADLAITKKHDPAKVRIGDITEFTLQVSNAGPSAAHRVVVTDPRPAD